MCRLTLNIQDIGKFCHSFEPFTCASYFSNVLIAKEGFTLVQSASKSGPPYLQGHLELLLEWLQLSEGAPKTFFRLHFFQTAMYATPTLKGQHSS